MREIAENVWHIPLTPRDGVNAYVLGDVLVDAGLAANGKRLPAKLGGHTIAAHTITHAHPDHVGGSKHVVDALDVPFWAPRGDAAAAEAGQAVMKDMKGKKLMDLTARFPAVRATRQLSEGDEVGGFTVLDTPGHSPGHISFWRESDRTLICGDVWFHVNFLTLKPQLRAPFPIVTFDIERNKQSMQRLIDLRPETVGFGHGPVMTGAAGRLRVV